ncbi:hypothetical protein [Stackebrandtia soli]|uniref:hypothetical protein n=1 Tax=Stackebrandtia soli TaxID=1892856 RepID=UPI0039E94E2B
MTWSMTISVSELKRITDKLLAELAEEHGEDVTFTEDYFWWIHNPHVYDVLSDVSIEDTTIGQLSESWDV